MLSSSICRLTRQLTATHLSMNTANVARRVFPPSVKTGFPTSSCQKTFATNRKAIDAKNVKRLKIQAKKKKNVTKPASAGLENDKSKDADQPFLQHQEWVKFQQSISVDGFQTGQVTSARVLKKSRGGKQARLRKEKEMARLQENYDQATDEKFPAIRYSQEETERLLELAFSSLPPRAGKRGTRNLKKQERRWKLVRDIRAKYKANIIAAHERRMEKRHWKRQKVIAAKEQAPISREKDLKYQGQVLSRWAETMFGDKASHLVDETIVNEKNTEGNKVTSSVE